MSVISRSTGRAAKFILAVTAFLGSKSASAGGSNFTPGFIQTMMIQIILSVIILGIVLFMLITFVKKYNVKNEDVNREGELNEKKFEIGWTLGAAAIVLFLFFASIAPTQQIYSPAGMDNVEETIRVTGGRDFSWTFTFENGSSYKANSAKGFNGTQIKNEGNGKMYSPLYLKSGVMYKLEITAEDNSQIHSFFVFDLSIKSDAVPGVINPIYLQADPGTYWGTCAELCGTLHYNMLFVIVVR